MPQGNALTGKNPSSLAPGARVRIRDEQWIVRRIDRTRIGDNAITVTGISKLVHGRSFTFLAELDPYTVLDPKDTKFVPDDSSGFRASQLHIESMLRLTPPTDKYIYLGHRAAMDQVSYQFVPAVMALEQPRPRILIADAVGLGKTLEAGILMAELIRRGRGKRILVVTLKSMLTQFQKELWTRFTIPLVRLDSVGIQHVRTKIPSNHNPFYYYDRAIISIDTLKDAREYRNYIEGAYWDIIVIDEAHNVAERRTKSLRSRLARLLATRSDTLIMLSATPHDGRARSFASLVNMLDPTAIADPDSYTKDDLAGKNLFVRRFKKDIRHEVQQAFPEREIENCRAQASPEEEAAFDLLANTPSELLSRRTGSAPLFRTVLEKAILSSPAACRKTIENRIRRLEKLPATKAKDLQALRNLNAALQGITRQRFSKYQLLLDLMARMGWTGKEARNRLVIFTERIDTLEFLSDALAKDLRLKRGAIAELYGSLSDIKQQEVVEDFGREDSPVRLLIASDVASEGINLHFQCHRMIHFDIPWSLMVFQQRNGRIDRYGQTRKPQIYYLITECKSEKLRGDARILELLVEKEKEAVKNIGDPATIIGVYDAKQEEEIVTEIIERGLQRGEAESHLRSRRQAESGVDAFDPVQALLGELPMVSEAQVHTRELDSLFGSDYAYLKAALQHLNEASSNGQPIQVDFHDEEKRLHLTAPADLKDRFGNLPREARPRHDIIDLNESIRTIKEEIKRCRAEDEAWPRRQYLWPLHPAVTWATDKVSSIFNSQTAPIVVMPEVIKPQAVVYVISTLFPNRKGQPVVQNLYAVRTRDGKCTGVSLFAETAEFRVLRTGQLSNTGEKPENMELVQQFLPEAVEWATAHVDDSRRRFQQSTQTNLQEHLDNLGHLKRRHDAAIAKKYDSTDTLAAGRRDKELRRVGKLFEEYRNWIADTMTIAEQPYIQVVAALVGAS